MANFRSTRLFAVLAGLLSATAPASARPSHCTSIAAARVAELESSVELIGTVTVPSGAFDGGFAIQQGHSGIYVVDSAGADYQIGDLVSVRGVLVNANNLLAVQPSATTLIRKVSATRPLRRETGSVGEATEGQLLRLRGTLIGEPVDDTPYGFKLTLDDGSGPVQVFLYPGTGIANTGLVDGAELSVVCFSNQYDTHYECDPRAPADLTLVP